MQELIIFIPYDINYTLILNNKNNSNNLYFYNNDYYFSIAIINKKIFINKDTNTIKLFDICFNNINKLANYEIKNFLFSWDSIYFNKIKFTGKGFKFRKKETNLFLFFNRAHKCFFIGTNIILIRLSKNKVILLKNNIKHLMYDSKIIRLIRSNNIFTKRGLRFSKQIIFKKKGKTATH